MYTEDSFFSLTQLGQLGLAALSLVLFVLTVMAMWRLARRVSVFVAIPVALVLFWAFSWLSPQIYYFYYMTQFEGLPWQSVIHPPVGPVEIAKLLFFQGEARLSEHSRGVLGWALIASAIWPRRDVGAG